MDTKRNGLDECREDYTSLSVFVIFSLFKYSTRCELEKGWVDTKMYD